MSEVAEGVSEVVGGVLQSFRGALGEGGGEKVGGFGGGGDQLGPEI